MAVVALLWLLPVAPRNSVPRPGIIFGSRLDASTSANPLGREVAISLNCPSLGDPQTRFGRSVP